MYGWVWAQFAPDKRAVAFERIAMKDFVISLLAATAMGIGVARAQSAIERLDPALDALLAPILGSRKSTKALPGTTGAQEAFSPAGRCSPYQRLPEREARIARRHSRGTKWHRFFARREVLYVNDIRAKKGVRYDMADDGALANGRVFIDMNSDPGPGNPDGMKIDV